MATSATTDRGTVTAGDSPDLRSYDWILVSSSAGKDSQAALDVVAEAASQAPPRCLAKHW